MPPASSLSEAARHYLGALAPVTLSAAIVLLPASLLAGGAAVFSLSAFRGALAPDPAGSHTEEVRDSKRDVLESGAKPEPGGAKPESPKETIRQAIQGESAFEIRFHRVASTASLLFIVTALLAGGLLLALAAVLPVVAGRALGTPVGAAAAWNAVAPRFGAVAGATFVAALLIGVGAVLLILPGLAIAVGFSFATPAAVAEGHTTRAALERSWRLSHGFRLRILAAWLLLLAFTFLSWRAGTAAGTDLRRIVVAGLLRALLYPFPLVWLAVLYLRARRAAGAPDEELLQYMRRISAPG